MGHILIVDDEKSINDLIVMNLTMVGHTSEQAFDGKEALKKLQTNHFDLCLLDIMLPGKDGFELIEDFKKYKVPVIYLSAKSSLGDRVKGLGLGAEEEELTDSNGETVVDETDTVSLIVEVEGMEETVPGYLHSTDGYKITYDMERFEYTKKDGSDTFIAENPDPEIYPYVYLSVNHIENKSVSDYAKELSKTLSENNLISETATDAAIGNYTGTIVRAQAGSEWNSIIRNYYIIENGKSIYVLESQYFVEAAEGYGARIYAMLNTFEIL